MVCELTGLPVANASLLDESTAAAEAMFMIYNIYGGRRNTVFVSDKVFPQTLALIKTRAEPLGINVVVGDPESEDFSDNKDLCGVIVQNPDVNGKITDWSDKSDEVHKSKGHMVIVQDILSSTLHKTPGEMGADISCGST